MSYPTAAGTARKGASFGTPSRLEFRMGYDTNRYLGRERDRLDRLNRWSETEEKS